MNIQGKRPEGQQIRLPVTRIVVCPDAEALYNFNPLRMLMHYEAYLRTE